MADIPTDWRRPLVMRSSRFVSQVTEGYRSGERYCFILGAGASITSGIKGGVALAREWQAYLRAKEAASPGYIRECADEYEDFDYERDVAPLFAEGYEPQSADYFSFYDLRFANMPTQAYAQLQALMEAARPSAGYHCLAVLLTDTENRLVITTNFDSLVEDALSLYNARRPLVLGHESLAPFMRGTENRGRVKIAKVHRDLLLHPKNRKREMAKLDEGWEGPLREALSGRTPIVVGYAGGDDTLMGLLEKMGDIGAVYWCELAGSTPEETEAKAGERVTEFLRRQSDGHLVPIGGFDQVMQELLDGFAPVMGHEDADDWLAGRIARSKVIHDRRFEEYFDAVTAPDPKEGKSGAEGRTRPTDGLDDADRRKVSLTAKAISASVRGRRALNVDDLESALGHFRDAVRIEPFNARYHDWLGTVLHVMERYDEALAESDEAMRLEPGSARYHDSRGATLHAMGRHEEALAELDEAVRLEPGSAFYHDSRGVTLNELGRHEEALAECDEAVRLEPENAEYHRSRGVTLRELGRLDESPGEVDHAIALAPDLAIAHGSRALTLRAMGREDEALAEEAKERELSGE